MPHYSLPELSPIPDGKTAADALAATVDLARWTERWGFQRSSQLLAISRLRTGDPGKLSEHTGNL